MEQRDSLIKANHQPPLEAVPLPVEPSGHLLEQIVLLCFLLCMVGGWLHWLFVRLDGMSRFRAAGLKLLGSVIAVVGVLAFAVMAEFAKENNKGGWLNGIILVLIMWQPLMRPLWTPMLRMVCRPLGKFCFFLDAWAQKDMEKQRQRKLLHLQKEQRKLQVEQHKLLSQ
jgi:hypothetical protein